MPSSSLIWFANITGLGVGKLMGSEFLRLAKELGYRASLFNLVFESNKASIALWQKLGFTELATIPEAFDQKGTSNLVSAKQFYYDFYNLGSSLLQIYTYKTFADFNFFYTYMNIVLNFLRCFGQTMKGKNDENIRNGWSRNGCV